MFANSLNRLFSFLIVGKHRIPLSLQLRRNPAARSNIPRPGWSNNAEWYKLRARAQFARNRSLRHNLSSLASGSQSRQIGISETVVLVDVLLRCVYVGGGGCGGEEGAGGLRITRGENWCWQATRTTGGSGSTSRLQQLVSSGGVRGWIQGGGGGAHKSSTHLQGRSRGRYRGAQHQKLLFWSPGSDPEGWGHQVLNKILTFSFVKSGLRSRILQIRRVLPLNQNPVPGPAPGFSGLGAVERKSSLEVASENCLDTKCD